MGEAERSIAIKRKTVVPKSNEREDSPSEVYTPKRKKSSGGEASPPPYIPSRKESGIGSTRTSSSSVLRPEHQDHGRHRNDARHILSSRDRTDLISRSRRMELFRNIGIDRKEEPVGMRYRDEPRKIMSGDRNRQKEVVAVKSTKDISSNMKSSSDVRDLKITARLGPAVRPTESRTFEGRDGGNKSTRTTYSKENTLQVIINPVVAPALKGSVASRLGKIVVKNPDNAGGKDRTESGKVDKNWVVGRGRERRKLAVTSHAKNLVNRQCREAVISVSSVDHGKGRRRGRSASPDSRVVETENTLAEVEDENEILIERKRSFSLSPSRSDKTSVEATNLVDAGTDKNDDDDIVKDEREPEDLAEMLGEDLEPELLNDTVTDELNLDLEEETEEADDIETLIGVKMEEDKPKAGTRFIVTLDGVDERQFEAEGSKNMDPSFIQPSIDNVPKLSSRPLFPQPKLSPLSPLLHVLPLQPPLSPHHNPPPVPVFSIGPPLPPPPIKPLPPKIQPFSINLKDSDDEIEDKDSRHQLPSPSGYMPLASTEGLSALRKAKLSERCKFWPACAAGSECEYHHPTSYCKTFPNCKFMGKCLFIHPNCKFDSKCTRSDCPFTHTSRRLGLGGTTTAIPTPPAPVTNTMCHFFPGCHNPSCPFLHPKPCRFGATCQSTGCAFYHPLPPPAVATALPTKDKLKWKAPTTLKESVPLKLTTTDPTTKFRQPVAKVSPMSSTSSNMSSNIH